MFKYVRGVACRDWVQCNMLHHVSFSVFVACNDAQMLTAPCYMLTRSSATPLSVYSLNNLDSISRKNINTTTYQ